MTTLSLSLSSPSLSISGLPISSLLSKSLSSNSLSENLQAKNDQSLSNISTQRSSTLADIDNIIPEVFKVEDNNHILEHDFKDELEDLYSDKKDYIFTQKLKFKLNDKILMRTNIISCAFIIILLILIYYIYHLLGEYLSIILFGILVSKALRSTKILLATRLKKKISLITRDNDNDTNDNMNNVVFLMNSYIMRLINFIKIDIVNQNAYNILKSFSSTCIIDLWLSLTNQIKILFYICILYAMFTKIGILNTFFIMMIGVLGDLLIRIIIDIILFITNNIKSIKFIKHIIKQQTYLETSIDSFVTTFLILALIVLFLLIISTSFLLLFYDLREPISDFGGFVSQEYKNVFKTFRNSDFQDDLMSTFHDTNGICSVLNDSHYKVYCKIFSRTINSWSSKQKNATDTLYLNHDNLPIYIFNEILSNCSSSSNSSSSSSLPYTQIIKDYYCLASSYANYFEFDLSSLNILQIGEEIKDGITFMYNLLINSLVLQILMISKAALNILWDFLIFIVLIYYLLENPNDWFFQITSLLVKDQKSKKIIDEKIEKSIEGVFLCTAKLFIWNILFTWIIFDYFEIELKYVASLLAGILSIFPIVSPWILCIPASLYLYLIKEQTINMVVMAIIYTIFSVKAYMNISERNIPLVHPYSVGLSIAMGIYSFGNVGIIYGPLLVCGAKIFYDMGKNYNTTGQMIEQRWLTN